MNLTTVAVFAEHASSYAGLCSGAHTFADNVIAPFIGSADDAIAIAACGARVLHLGAREDGVMLEDYSSALAATLSSYSVNLVLLQSSKRSRVIAGRMAVAMGAGTINDAASFRVIDPGTVDIEHRVYGGMAIQTERASHATIALVGSSVFEERPSSETGEVVTIPPHPLEASIKVISSEAKHEESVDLGAAKRVVGVGRGIESQENVVLAETLAKTIDAELACTRPIAEGEGWMTRSRYLGVSGNVIQPDVYLACGVSGQVQHMVGVSDAKTIIAIDKDRNAPIFKNCDVGIVGDINKIIPSLIQAFS